MSQVKGQRGKPDCTPLGFDLALFLFGLSFSAVGLLGDVVPTVPSSEPTRSAVRLGARAPKRPLATGDVRG